MNYKVVRSHTFENQLDQILDYIKVSFSKEHSLDYLVYLEKQIDNLNEFPNLGKKVCFRLNTFEPTNAFISKKNIVFYRINEEEKTITLIAITTASQNYLSLMK